jgi:hypothetical protein
MTMPKVRRTVFYETNQLVEILPLNQIRLSVCCDIMPFGYVPALARSHARYPSQAWV